MPTEFDRIAVTKTPELNDVLDRVSPFLRPGTPTATAVRELAIRGAEALLAEHEARRDALERLAEWSTGADSPFDRDVLARIDREAWGFVE